MDLFTLHVTCKWAVTFTLQLFFFLLTSMIGAKVFLEALRTIFPDKTERKLEREHDPEQITKPKDSQIEEIRTSESLTKKPSVLSHNIDLGKNYKLDLLRTNHALKATIKQLEETKEKVSELEEKIQHKDNQLQRAFEELEQCNTKYEDLVVLDNKVKNEPTRAERILRQQARAALKPGNHRGNPETNESSPEIPVIAMISNDPEVVHDLQLESRDNDY